MNLDKKIKYKIKQNISFKLRLNVIF